MSAKGEPRLRLAPQPGPGRLIAIEGLDGSGKTTLVAHLRADLARQGIPVTTTRLPTTRLRRTRSFRLLRDQGRVDLVDPLAFELAYMADRIHHCRSVIEPALRAGTTVITDRYAFSSIGTLLLRLPPLRQVVLDGILVDAWFTDLCRHLIQPDLWFLLQTDAATAAGRLRVRRGEADTGFCPAGYNHLRGVLLRLARANDLIPVDASDTASATLTTCRPYVARLGLGRTAGERR